MDPIPLITPEAFRPFVAFAARIGQPWSLPRAARLAKGPLPMVAAGLLLEELAAATGADSFGLRAGAASRFEDVPLARDVRSSLTVGSALRAASHASSNYCAGQRLWVTQRGEDIWVQRRFPDELRHGRRQANDFALQMLLDLVRRGAGARWRPAEIHFEGPPPGHAEELADLAARSTSFGATADAVVFPRSVLALPLPSMLQPVAQASPALLDVDFVSSVRLTIAYLLELDELSLPGVAETAGISARSLQRRLAASGVAYGQLVAEARFQTASRLLRDPAVRIIDVSTQLGYSDAANFTRAFRRWAGVSPLAFRRRGEAGLLPAPRNVRSVAE